LLRTRNVSSGVIFQNPLQSAVKLEAVQRILYGRDDKSVAIRRIPWIGSDRSIHFSYCGSRNGKRRELELALEGTFTDEQRWLLAKELREIEWLDEAGISI
jgi:hypothetical protein